MTDPRRRELAISRPRLYGTLAAIAVAAAALLSYALGVFDSESGPRIRAGDVCSGLEDKRAAVKDFDSLLPQHGGYKFRDLPSTETTEGFSNECYVVGDQGDTYLHLVASLGFAAPEEDGKNWETKVLKPLSTGEFTHFDAGFRGTSAPNLAGINVPCLSAGNIGDMPYNLTVYTHAQKSLRGSDREKRQKFIDLALDFARTAHKQAKCDRPSQLPDRVTAPGE